MVLVASIIGVDQFIFLKIVQLIKYDVNRSDQETDIIDWNYVN
jgi:hypothetical protein